MRLTSLPALMLLAATACATAVTPTPPAPPPTPAPLAQPVATTPTPAPTPETLVLPAALQQVVMTEIMLDPRGNAAITFDEAGGARLWPDLRAQAPAPIALPFTEAASASLAAAGERRFIVAAIDTAGATRVGQVDIDAQGARWQTLFELPATDPLLEIHVLDGGARLLALGLDHRLRLYDPQGNARSIIDTPSFIPWQLRVAQRPDKPPAIVAVLANPVRAQPISLTGDTLTIAGEARMVALDQGPNHNDLALSPDGTFVTALRRPKAEGRGWYLERIDLASGERRWLAGDVDTLVRPRLHLVEPNRALLEGGSGKGFWIDLSAAQLPPPGVPFDRKLLPRTQTKIVAVPGSTEDSRMWSTVAAGVRVVAEREALLVDPLTSDEHLRIAAETFRPTLVALDVTGERLAWVHAGHLLVETFGQPAPPRTIATLDRPVKVLAFVDPARLILVDDRGSVTLRRFDDGAVLGQVKALPSWLALAAYHPGGKDSGTLAVTGKAERDPVILVPVDASGLGAHRKATESERTSWPELGLPAAEYKRQQAQLRAATGDDTLVVSRTYRAEAWSYLLTRSPNRRIYRLRDTQAESFELIREGYHWLAPSPGSPLVAVIEDTSSDDPRAMSIIDFGRDTPRKLWGRAYPQFANDIAWSADGARLVIAADPALMFDATTGALLLERHHLGLTVQHLPDAKPPAAHP
jgi:hypothetical protein